MNQLVQKTISFTLIAGILISVIFLVYSVEIGNIFYPKSDVAKYLYYLAPLVPFMYLESAIYGIMQGLNQQRKVLLYNIIDLTIRLIAIFLLVPKYRNERVFMHHVF